ncbi:hypothetical protein [Pseudomonas anguilliseptica]|uniref:hypothetical protein n=1 Tax=Pseudomonas anguilliseptica TaxID=53406 RepID=UPI0022AF8AE6|nr:hypothetical protein [Pseudomonas anguilliseptica]MCZ4323885.1 hypothetical protein [Pseudomonas anguilliseptica]
MYKEVALNPSCLGRFEYYSLLKQQFGFDKGRYVAADRRAWAQEAMAAVKQAGLSVIREQSIKNYLNKLPRSKERDEFLLAPDRPKSDYPLWSTWLDSQLLVRPFDATISEPADNGRLDIDAINNGHHGWVVPASISVPRTAAAIVDAVCGLLRLSTQITLIDPYFRLANNRTFSELFRVLQGTLVRSICVVSTIDTADPRRVYQREYLAINGSGVGLEWVVAPDQFFHDRYLLTDAGAVRAGHGFMSDVVKGAHADLLNLNLIGVEEAERTKQSLISLLEAGRATRITIV